MANKSERTNINIPHWPSLPSLGETPRESFPLHALSPSHRAYVTSVGETFSAPVDLPAMISLSALSAATAKTVTVSIRNSPPQPVVLWVLGVLGSGEGKTPVVQEITGPIERAEAWLVGDAEERIRKSEIQCRVLARRQRHLEALAARAPDDAQREERQAEAEDVAAKLQQLSRAVKPRLIVGNITPEALVTRLAEQQGRLALLSDEGGELFGGLHSRAIRGDDPVEQLMKAFSGAPIRVDRQSRSQLIIRDPALTIGTTVQLSVLHDLVRSHGSKERGFIERFLFSLPAPLPARVQSCAGIHQESRQSFANAVDRLLKLPVHHRGDVNQSEPPTLVIDGEAGENLSDFAAEIDQRSRGDGDLVHLFSWVSKLRGNVARIAALLHMYDGPSDGLMPGTKIPIHPSTVARAILIGRYCLSHALAAYGVGGMVGDEELHVVLGWLRRQRQTRIRLRDLHRGVQHKFATVAALRRALEALIDDGYIRPVATGQGRRGRPPTEYDVHPVLLGAHDTMTESPLQSSLQRNSAVLHIEGQTDSVIVSPSEDKPKTPELVSNLSVEIPVESQDVNPGPDSVRPQLTPARDSFDHVEVAVEADLGSSLNIPSPTSGDADSKPAKLDSDTSDLPTSPAHVRPQLTPEYTAQDGPDSIASELDTFLDTLGLHHQGGE